MKYTKNNKKKIKKKSKSKKLFKGGVFDLPYDEVDDLARQIYDQQTGQTGLISYQHDHSHAEDVERLRSFKPNIQKLHILNQYVKNLQTKTTDCNIPETSCKTFSSGASGQIVKKCGDSIYKGPNQNLILNIETSRNGYSYLLDPNTMNLLVQSVIKYLIEMRLINNVEHYEQICSGNIDNGITVPYYLKGKSYEYCPEEDVNTDDSDADSVATDMTDQELRGGTVKKCFNSLESYLVENEIINVEWVADWLQQIFDILDQLFDLIQFHHCDPKAAQIFLNTNERNEVVAILGDLDKVTFSLGVGNKAFRMRLGTSTLYSIAAHRPEFTNFSTAMRYQDSALETNIYEKLAFLYSSCLLCNNLEQAKELKKIVLEKNRRFLDYFSVAEITDQIWRKKEIPPIKGIKNRMTGLFISPQGKARKFNLGYPLQFISVDKTLKYIPINSQVNLNEEFKLELVKDKKSSGGKKTKNKKKRRKKKNTKKRKL